MKKPLISIIVPIYKVEQYLKRCVDSLLNQTYQKLEIILVDDGSPDACPQMCDDFAKLDSRVKVIHKQNGGLMAAWIDGVKSSSGEFVAFVDSDDWVEQTFIEDLYVPFSQIEDLGLSICKYYRAKSESEKLEQNATKDNLVGLIEGDELENYKNSKLRNFTSFRWNKLFRRENIISNLKYCDPRISICEDVCISIANVLDSKKIFISDKYLYNYYDRATSMINAYKPNLLKNFEYFYPKYYQLLEEKKYLSPINANMELIVCLFAATENLICSDAKNKSKTFKTFYESFLMKNLLSSKLDGVVSKKHKFFVFALKTRCYPLIKLMILFNKKKSKILNRK